MTEIFRPEVDGVRMELSSWQVDLLSAVPMLVEDGQQVLPSDVYRDDGEANAEFRRYMDDEAKEADRADLAVVLATLGEAVNGVVLSPSEAEAWLRAVGKARLILADRLGITTAAWESEEPARDTPELDLLHYLSWIQSSLVDSLGDLLPEPAG